MAEGAVLRMSRSGCASQSGVLIENDELTLQLGARCYRVTRAAFAIWLDERWEVADYRVNADKQQIELVPSEQIPAELLANAECTPYSVQSASLQRLELRPSQLIEVAGKRRMHWAVLPSEMAQLYAWFGLPCDGWPAPSDDWALARAALPRLTLIDETLVVQLPDGQRWVCDASGCQRFEPLTYWTSALRYKPSPLGKMHSAALGRGSLRIGRQRLIVVDEQRRCDIYECCGLFADFDRELWPGQGAQSQGQ